MVILKALILILYGCTSFKHIWRYIERKCVFRTKEDARRSEMKKFEEYREQGASDFEIARILFVVHCIWLLSLLAVASLFKDIRLAVFFIFIVSLETPGTIARCRYLKKGGQLKWVKCINDLTVTTEILEIVAFVRMLMIF